MATKLQEKVDAIQAKVDANNIARTSDIPSDIPVEPVTPLQAKVDAIQAKVDANNATKPSTIEAIRAARAKVNAPAPGQTAPVNIAPLTPGQEIAKSNLENRPKPVDTTKIGTGVGENFVSYKPVDQTNIPDTTGKVNPDGTPIVPEVKKETTTAPQKKLETTTPQPIVVQNEDEAFKTLMSGGNLADTKENNAFKQTYKQFGFYNGLDNKTLANKISSGEVGPKFTNLLARFNPTKYAEVVKMSENITSVNDINTNAQRLYSTATGTPQKPVEKASDKLMQEITDSINNTPESYSDIVAKAYAENPDIKQNADKLAVLDDKIDTIDTEIDKLAETYRTQYPDVPQAMLMGMVNRSAYGLTQERNALVKESKLLYSQYKDAKDMVDMGIQYDIAQDEKKQQRMFDLYGVVRGEEIRQEDFARADQKLADEIARADKKDQATLDRLEQERTDNVKTAIAQLGVKPVGETYDELLGEYAEAVKNQPQKNEYIQTDKPIYDTASGKWIMPPGAGTPTGNTAPAPSRTPTIQSSFTPEGTFQVDIANGATPRKSSRGYYECAMLVNDTLGTAMPDLHVDKLKYNNSSTPVVGGAFIEKTNDKYGHTGIIESINPNGTLNIVETNYPLGSGVRRTTIDPSKRNIVGYYDPQTAGQTGYRDITDITLPEKTTEFKAKSFGYGTRMDNSDKTLQSIDKKFMESGTTGEYLTPRGDYVPNWLKGTEQQQYEQAQRDFINAKLRQESGAVISPSEFDNAKKQYFPQPGDTNETILQKQKNRELVIMEMFRNAGKTENGEDIQNIYKSIRSNKQGEQTQTPENYSRQEEQLIKDLVAKGATDEEIDQAIILFRK